MPSADRPGPAELAVCSTGSGPAVVWIHGYTMDSTMWQHLWPLLPGYRHIGVDLPGHGGSPPLTPATTLHDMASGVARIMRRERASRLVAVSMGTMVAFEVAIRALHPVAKLAVVAPALVGMPAAAGTAARYRMLTQLYRAGVRGAGLVDVWMASPPGIFAGINRFPGRRSRLRDVVARHSWAELAFGGPAAFHTPAQSLAALPGSAAELLVLAGDEDMPEFRDLGEQLGRQVAGTDVVTVAGAGHLPLLEFPDRAVPVLGRFLAAGRGAAGAALADPPADSHNWWHRAGSGAHHFSQ